MARTAYHMGRLLAALEHLGVVEEHATIGYQAWQQPTVLLPALARATQQGEHARDLVTGILADADDVPVALDNEQQGDFGLGYYHQRAAFRTGVLPSLDQDEPTLTARMEVRIDPDLKAWVEANGGGKLVRALLRAARERQ